MLEKSVIDEMRNIAENEPVFPGDTLSHATANECVYRGWADRNNDGDFVATDKGRAALDMWPEEMAKILAESPTTSLARLKAKWQAEALDFLESRIKPLHQSDNGVQGKGYNMALDDCLACIDMIRRQTKEGGTT